MQEDEGDASEDHGEDRLWRAAKREAIEVKLHLGCGGVHLEGYLNVDVREEANPDVVWDLTKRWCVDPAHGIDEVLSFHVLEHLTREQGLHFLAEAHRVLRPGGKLILELPDAKKAAREWLYGNDSRRNNLWGLQRNPYDFHRWGYDPEGLRKLLEDTGDWEVCHVGPGTDYHSKHEPCFRLEAWKHRGMVGLKSDILDAMPEDLRSIHDPQFFVCWGKEPDWKATPSHHALHYRLCCAVTRILKPMSILEIGVRMGYSLGALMAGHIPVYAEGWDSEAYIKGSLKLARKNLSSVVLGANLKKRDSQEVDELCSFGLVHVDGDHTYKGAAHDIRLAMQEARWVLVDDYHPKNHPGVFRAVEEASDEEGWDLITFEDEDFPNDLPTKGLALLVRRT